MKKINVFSMFVVAVVAMFAIIACGNATKGNVYTKKSAAYKVATAKVNAVTDVDALNDINALLEKEIAAINVECEAEYEKIFEEKLTNADLYRSDEDALKAAQKEYDDLYVEKYFELKNL